MTWVDGLLLAMLAVSAGVAYSRGLVREVLGAGAWIGALILAFALLPRTLAVMDSAVQPDWLASAVAVGGVFLVALLVLKLAIAWVARLVRASALGGVDRALGTLFGLARGAFIAVLAYIATGVFLPSAERWPEPVRNARALPLVADGARWLVDSLPLDYRPRVPDAPPRPLPPMEDLLRPPARGRT